ncbi:MAG: glycosyltransferase [Candidatus Bathyarchaeota archaeon]|nr:glycosyltransferase [Candidatus Bathyarchaeota archaeon]
MGGDATHVKYLAEELARIGHEIHVIHSIDAYRVKRSNSFHVKEPLENNNLHVHRVESIPHQKDPALAYVFGHCFSVERKFDQVILRERPEIVHYHNISLLGYSIMKKKGNYLSLYTAHDYWLICQMNNLVRNNLTHCVRKQCYSCALSWKRFPQFWRRTNDFKQIIFNIDLLISPSDYVRKRLLQEVHLNSCTLPNFAPKPPENIPKTDFSNYFLFVGMLEEHKGILSLLDVFKTIKNDLKASLLIVGGGSLETIVRNYIEKNSLGDRVHFLGFVNYHQLYSLYSNALALIVPSIWPENAPLVALEALSVGTPVIASNKGGLPEIVRKVDKILIFNDNDQLKTILLSFSRQAYPVEKIKSVYKKNYSPEAYIERYLKAIKMLTVRK